VEEFTLTGELTESCTTLNLTFGKALKRVLHGLVGKELLIDIRPMQYKRSSAQNRYYWGVVIVCVRAWHKETQGETITKDQAHAYILTRVQEVEPKFKTVFGEEVMYFDYKTTSQMNTKEFNEFKEKVQTFFYDVGCNIPDPTKNSLTQDYIR